MIAELQQRFDAIQQQRQSLLDCLRALDTKLLEYQPSPRSWSMLQVAQHLVLVETLLVDSMLRADRPPVRVRWWHAIGRWLLFLVYRYGLRVPAPTKRIIPVAKPPLEESARAWEALRQRLRAFLEATTPESARNLGFRHPVSGPHDVAETLDFIRMHFEHHLRQLARIQVSAATKGIEAPSGPTFL